MKIEILIADDHAIIRNSLKNLLADTEDLVVAGEAVNGEETLAKIHERNWGLLILDLSMPGSKGLELLTLIKRERQDLPILVFSMHHEAQYAERAIRAGALGYVSKDSELLLAAIRSVLKSEVFVDRR